MLRLEINQSETQSAASPEPSFSSLSADWTEAAHLNVFSLLPAAGTEQLCPLLHLRCQPEGALPEHRADHPRESPKHKS